MEKIKVANLTYSYPGGKEPALSGVNLSVKEGEFVLVIGESGSGKSTLLKWMSGIIPEFCGGEYSGEVYIDGIKLRQMKKRERVGKIGFLFQNPENQLFTSRVEKELVFALENLGFSKNLMRKRVAETANFFNLSSYLNARVAELSGGMKQKLALASLMAMQPEVLILDEPLSQLDPEAAEEILYLLLRLNEENGITIVMAEQRLERCLAIADRIVVMDKGKIVFTGGCRREIGEVLGREKFFLLPPLSRLFARMGEEEIPFTVKEARSLLHKYDVKEGFLRGKQEEKNSEILLEVKGLWYSYPEGKEVLVNIDFAVCAGNIWLIMGENGAGKTTLLKAMAGLLKPGRGKISCKGIDLRGMKVKDIARKVSYVPQNPDDYFFLPSVREEISFNLRQAGRCEEEAGEIMAEFGLLPCALSNPRDLSMGEKQRLILAAVSALNPDIILLDEPTRGLDYRSKEKLGEWLKSWVQKGKAAVIVSHDVEFAAEYGDKVMLLFNGEIAAKGSKYEIMDNSLFYSPAINRVFRSKGEKVLSYNEAYQIIKVAEGKDKRIEA